MASASAERRWWQHWDSDDERKKIESYWKNAADQPERRKHFYRALTKELKAYPEGTRLLDFGCGTGVDTSTMLSLGVDYHGADVTPNMLARARANFPSLPFEVDDMLGSKYAAEQWPIVVCNAVLPHLPADRIATAIRELWRITEKLLIVRLFGVDTEKEDNTVILDGFIYQRWTTERWTEMFQVHAEGASKIRVYTGKAITADCLIICCQR